MTDIDTEAWRRLLALRRPASGVRPDGGADVAAPQHSLFRDVYRPLIARLARGPLTLGQIGQSIDGRIATESGHSHYINAEGGLDHLHRLRALTDAVVIGAQTAVLDDPQLTTRRVEGPSPVRVVLDPRRRVPRDRRCFDAAAPTLWLIADAAPREPSDADADTDADAAGGGQPQVVRLPAAGGAFDVRGVLAALHRRGLHAVLIEGGAATLSAFVQARALDRLHVMLAPLLIGSGRAAFVLPEIARLDEARRFRMTAHDLGSDVLLDCRLEADA